MTLYIKSCKSCKYKKRNALQEPCRAGVNQMYRGKQKYCSYYKLHLLDRLKRFKDKLCDDLEFIRLKLSVVFILMIIGFWIDGR